MPAIYAEVAVGCEEKGIGEYLGHPDEAGIGKAHRYVSVLLHQPKDGLDMIAKLKSAYERAPAKQVR